MIEELRIKCPSCGIILDVRNSRHEAVKKIICPNCKKQLAVDFREQEEPKPAPLGAIYYNQLRIDLHEGVNQISIPDCEHLELNVVLLSDGSSKCMVRPLSAEHPVLLNGQPMEIDDQVVLAMGDELKIGNTTLTYGQSSDPGNDDPTKIVPPPQPKPKKNISRWLIGGSALIAALVCVVLFWPKKSVIDNEEEEEDIEARIDTPIVIPTHQDSGSTRNVVTPSTSPRDSGRSRVVPPPTPPTNDTGNDYELEVKASQGDVTAMYELGRRWVNTSKHASGVQYLKKAAVAGHSGAQQLVEENDW